MALKWLFFYFFFSVFLLENIFEIVDKKDDKAY